MICSSLYRLFFMPCPPVQFTRELQFSLVEFFGGTSLLHHENNVPERVQALAC